MSVPTHEPIPGRVLYDYQIANLEGQLLTFLETLGLRETQEKAAKDMLRGIVRTQLYIETIWVDGDILRPATDKQRDRQEAAYKAAQKDQKTM